MNQLFTLPERRRAELDAAAMQLLQIHGVLHPPVPIEDILRSPAADLWHPDLDDLSLQSFDALERYAARPTIARLVARYAGQTGWAHHLGLTSEAGFSVDEARYFARTLLMPRDWMLALHLSERNPASVRLRFHVPAPDAVARLSELFLVPAASSRVQAQVRQ